MELVGQTPEWRQTLGNLPASSPQPTISLAEHDRTLDEVVRERDQLRRERVHTAAVLEAFRDATLSISSVQPILDLADALCGPKEMVCPPLS